LIAYTIKRDGQLLVLSCQSKYAQWSTRHFDLADLLAYVSSIKVAGSFVDKNMGHFTIN